MHATEEAELILRYCQHSRQSSGQGEVAWL